MREDARSTVLILHFDSVVDGNILPVLDVFPWKIAHYIGSCTGIRVAKEDARKRMFLNRYAGDENKNVDRDV